MTNTTEAQAEKNYALTRLRVFLALIAAANLLCGAIWTKISYDISGLFSAGFNIGLALVLCGIAALRCMSFAQVLARKVSEPTGAEDVPAGAEAPQPPARA